MNTPCQDTYDLLARGWLSADNFFNDADMDAILRWRDDAGLARDCLAARKLTGLADDRFSLDEMTRAFGRIRRARLERSA